VKDDLGSETGAGQRARSDLGSVQFDVSFSALPSESHGVHGNVAGAQRADGVGADPSRIVASVAQQHYRADGQIGRLGAQLLQAVADAGGGSVWPQILKAIDARRRVVQAVKTCLKGAAEAPENSVLNSFHSLGFAT